MERIRLKNQQKQRVRERFLPNRKRTPRNSRVNQALTEKSGVDPENLPKYNPKRLAVQPNISDEVMVEQLLDKVRDGHFLTVACDLVGVSYESIISALEKGQEGKNDLYYDFWVRFRQAEAEAEETMVQLFKNGAIGDWKAAMEYLGRRWPQRWVRRDAKLIKHEHGGTISHDVRDSLADKILEDPDLLQQARNFIKQTQFEEEKTEIVDGDFEEV